MSDLDEQLDWEALRREIAVSRPGLTPGFIESRLRAAVRKRGLRRRMGIGAAGIAACLLLFGWGWRVSIPPVEQPSPSYTGFMALPYAQSDVPMEEAVVVRVTLRSPDLETLGLPAALLAGRQGVRADLLIGQDGIARAVRLPE